MFHQYFTLPHFKMTPHDNIRIAQTRPLLAPSTLIEEVPLTKLATKVIEQGRQESSAILRGDDDRLCVVCGPCSIHDTKAALEYAERPVSYTHLRAHET